MLRICLVIFLGGLLNPDQALAQGSPALWFQGAYQVWRVHGWSIGLDPEFRLQSDRMQENHRLWDGRRYWYAERFQVDLKGEYRHQFNIVSGAIGTSLGGGTRLAWRNLPYGNEVRPRLFGDFKSSFQWQQWSMAYRLRWQQQFSDFGSSTGAELLSSYGRHKFVLEYKWAKGRSLEWAEEWWVPVPGKIEGWRSWGLSQHDHRRSTFTAQFRRRGQGWSLGVGWDRDRFSPEGSGSLYLLRLGHRWGRSKSSEKSAGD